MMDDGVVLDARYLLSGSGKTDHVLNERFAHTGDVYIPFVIKPNLLQTRQQGSAPMKILSVDPGNSATVWFRV